MNFGDPKLPERFWNKVHNCPITGCWLWTAGKNTEGYGVINFRIADTDRRRQAVSHRFAYEALVAPVARHLSMDHLCRVRHCVNPLHLEPVTQRENCLRGVGLSAKAAAATHCPAGHEYAGDVLYIDPAGYRHCRVCRRAAVARVRARQRTERLAC